MSDKQRVPRASGDEPRAARWALRLIGFLFGLALLILVLAFGDADDLFGDDHG